MLRPAGRRLRYQRHTHDVHVARDPGTNAQRLIDMRMITARQAWHDAFNDTLSPDLVSTLMNLSRGTAHDQDAKKWHQMLAGKVQHAASRLPGHLHDWGMLCFAPDTFRTVQQYNRVEDELWRQFKLTETYQRHPTQSIPMMTLCRMAVEQQIHREQSGRERFTQADCYGRLHLAKHEWERHGMREAWSVLIDIISDWTGWTLEPVAQLIEEFREARGEWAPVRGT